MEVITHNDENINPPNTRAIAYDVLKVGLGDIGKIKVVQANEDLSRIKEIKNKEFKAPSLLCITKNLFQVYIHVEQHAAQRKKLIVSNIDFSLLPKIPAVGSSAFDDWISPFFDHVDVSEEDPQPKKGKSSSKGGGSKKYKKK